MSSATTSSTRSTSTTTATGSPTSRTSSASRPMNTIPTTFLYNIGPIESLNSAYWNRRQYYSVTQDRRHGSDQMLGREPAVPAVQHRPAVDAELRPSRAAAVHAMPGGRTRVRRSARRRRSSSTSVRSSTSATCGRSRTCTPPSGSPRLQRGTGRELHSRRRTSTAIAIQVPISDLTAAAGEPTSPTAARTIIGVWTTASRQQGARAPADGRRWDVESGPWVQVSRLGNPLVNEVLVPLAQKDYWNATAAARATSSSRAASPTPNSRGCSTSSTRGPSRTWRRTTKPRADLEAIFLTGIPAGVVSSTLLDVHRARRRRTCSA